jgi:four helix bundle protein
MERPSRGFRDLVAWQKADDLASLVYKSVRPLRHEHAWLADQAVRAAVSVPANIAEGHGRGSLAELARFVDIARGSLAELEYYIHFMAKQGLLPATTITDLAGKQVEASRLLFGFWRSLKATDKQAWDHSGRTIRDGAEFYSTD